MKLKSALLVLSGLLFVTILNAQNFSKDLVGAWQREADGNTITMICSEKYFVVSMYNLKDKKFQSTHGGSWTLKGNTLKEVQEFNTLTQEEIGKQSVKQVKLNKGQLIYTTNNKDEVWTRIDNGEPGKLAGAWLITGRVNEGSMQAITPGARRTMKILSGTRFQWIAYNTETKEFFGTGGGTYTTENGKYIESIEFFSRDNSRVGMTLQFDFSLDEGNWRHKGLSSKGDPIDEVWTKREKLKL